MTYGTDATEAQGRATAASKRASSHNGLVCTPYHDYYVEEEWRPVVGWEGWYSVSNLGRVRRESMGRGSYPGRILKPRWNHLQRYPQVSLSRGNKVTPHYIHRLVAMAFLGSSPAGKEQINHRDGDRTNNAVSNLEFVTSSENVRHALRLGLRRRKYGQQHLALALEVGA